MRPHGSILSQALVAFSAFAVLIAIAAAVGYLGLAHQNSATTQLTGQDYVLQQAVGRMDAAFTVSQVSINSYALTGQRASLAPMGGARAGYTASLAALQGHVPPPLRRYAVVLTRSGGQLFAVAGQISAAAPGSRTVRDLASGTARISGGFYAASTAMQEYLAKNIRQLTAQSKHSLSVGLAWSAAAIAVAVALILLACLSTVRGITRPLRSLAATVRRLTSGDHAARATVTGSAEVREVAQSVNTMAREDDRLRGQEQEHARLRALAREAGIRVREPLRAEDVLREASTAITQCVRSDLAVLRLVEDEHPRYGDYTREDWLPVSFLTDMSPDFENWAHGHLKDQSSTVIQDVRGEEGELLPPSVREPLLRYGVVSHMATPFGIGSELYGIVELERTRPGQPWTPAEVDAIQSIAADIGRGLKHARLYEAENGLVEQLKHLNQAKSDFFATVSHELRAPLTSIEGYLEMLRDEDAGPVSAAQERMLETIGRNAIRLRNLIEDLFMLSKIESGGSQTVLRPVNLVDVVRDAAQVLLPSVAGTGLTMTVTCPDESLVVNGDVSQLDRVVMNLLSNAAKFTPPGGRISLTAARDGDTAVMSVGDTGIGIPEKDKDALFGRFFRASNAVRRSIPGTGLGLAIVSSVIAEHGGEVTVQSAEGVGTTFRVRLPLLPVDAVAPPDTLPAHL
jgi:two-component system, OmpR family, phosphate regulon sensor histidine kinase PhoR